MQVTVEFFGIPRQRAGRAVLEVSLPDFETPATLGEILNALACELPEFSHECLVENRLRLGYIANLSGKQFLTDPEALIPPGETVLILSADAGG